MKWRMKRLKRWCGRSKRNFDVTELFLFGGKVAAQAGDTTDRLWKSMCNFILCRQRVCPLLLCCAVLCCATPVRALVPCYNETPVPQSNLYRPDTDEMRRIGNRWAVGFVGLGFCALLGNLILSTGFAVAGERMTRSLRKRAFEAMVRE